MARACDEPRLVLNPLQLGDSTPQQRWHHHHPTSPLPFAAAAFHNVIYKYTFIGPDSLFTQCKQHVGEFSFVKCAKSPARSHPHQKTTATPATPATYLLFRLHQLLTVPGWFAPSSRCDDGLLKNVPQFKRPKTDGLRPQDRVGSKSLQQNGLRKDKNTWPRFRASGGVNCAGYWRLRRAAPRRVLREYCPNLCQ
jgi:hypothetical protein